MRENEATAFIDSNRNNSSYKICVTYMWCECILYMYRSVACFTWFSVISSLIFFC